MCPFPRAKLGSGWQRSSTTCRVPLEITQHIKTFKGKEISKVIFEKTDILVSVRLRYDNENFLHVPASVQSYQSSLVLYQKLLFFDSVNSSG